MIFLKFMLMRTLNTAIGSQPKKQKLQQIFSILSQCGADLVRLLPYLLQL